MSDSHDEIKKLLEASRRLLNNDNINEDIRRQYGLLTEQGVDLSGDNVTQKTNIAKSVEDTIDYETADDEEGYDDEEESKDDKSQGFRISGGILVLHGKEQTDLELTTDEKIAFQETMDEFTAEVSDMVDFNKLNVYTNNVEWSGKLIEHDIEFFFSIGEENGVYINGEMIKTDDEFISFITKLKTFYEKFKSKWAKVISTRKKTEK
jgi:hypothetical protein